MSANQDKLTELTDAINAAVTAINAEIADLKAANVPDDLNGIESAVASLTAVVPVPVPPAA